MRSIESAPPLRDPWFASIVERRLANGARVVVVPTRSTVAGGEAESGRHRAPVAIELWVLGGTAAEQHDEHGCAHLLEHMLFKPTAHTPGSGSQVDIASAIETLGGDVNAFTSHDETVFHATVPVSEVDRALAALVEPVVHPQIDPEELRREIGVVIEEIKQYDDDPSSAAQQDLMELLFREHSYARPVLGRAFEVRRHDVARLEAFHRALYTADRTVLVVVGPVDAASILSRAEGMLRALPRRGRILRTDPVDAPASPRVRIRGATVSEGHLTLGWHAPRMPDPEACALEIAAVVLGYGDASRLDQQTRRGSKVVTEAQAHLYASREGSSFVISAAMPPRSFEPAIAELLRQVDRLRRVPIDDEELGRARAVLHSDLVYRRESVQGLGYAVGNQLSLSGDLGTERIYYEALANVDANMIMAACRRWLAPSSAALAAVVPTANARGPRGRALKTRVAQQLRAAGRNGRGVRVRTVDGIVCAQLPSGLRLRLMPDPSVPMAAGWLVWSGGQRAEAARDAGAGMMMGELLTRGCAAIEGDALAREIDGRAAVLEGFSGRNTMGLHFECLAPHVAHVLRRMIECAVAPLFAESEFDEERRVALEDLDAAEDDPAGVAFREAMTGLYRSHPFGRNRRGTAASLGRLTSARLARLWSDRYALGNAVLGICGDFDPQAVVGLCRALDDEARSGDGAVVGLSGAPRYPKRSVTRMVHADREQTHFVLAWPGLQVDDGRVYALEVLLAVLGGQAGRLFESLRERRGLVYNVSTSSAEGVDAGHVTIHGASSHDTVSAAIEAVEAELERLCRDGVSAEELGRAKAWIVGQHEVEMQRRSRVATQLAFDEVLGLPLGLFRAFARRVTAVNGRAVRTLARELFAETPRVTAIVGQPKDST